jgi:hypothetical protein
MEKIPMDTNETQTVKAPAHPVGRPRQGLDTRLIANFEKRKVDAVKLWLEGQAGNITISDFLREAYDDAMRKHGIVA